MFRANYKKLSKTEGIVGGITNESRWYQTEDEKIRTKKRFTIPAISGGSCTMEQGWNEASKKKDVIRMTVEKDEQEIEVYFNRQDFEQMIFSMASGDETIKYIRTEARAQREYAK